MSSVISWVIWGFCVLLIQSSVISSFPSANFEGFHEILHEQSSPSFDLNEEESEVHSTAVPPPNFEFTSETPGEAQTESSLLKPDNHTENYEDFGDTTTVDPIIIIHQRYEIEVTDPSDKRLHVKRGDDEAEVTKTDREREEEESTPAYGVLESASSSLPTEEGDDQQRNISGIHNCGKDLMETEKPILKHSELEEGVLHEAKSDPLPDFDQPEGPLKELDDDSESIHSASHESNSVQVPTAEAYTAQETQIVIEDTSKPEETTTEKMLLLEEMKAGTALKLVVLKDTENITLRNGSKLTHLNLTQSTDDEGINVDAEPNPESSAQSAEQPAASSMEAHSRETKSVENAETTPEPLESNPRHEGDDEEHQEFDDEVVVSDDAGGDQDGEVGSSQAGGLKHGATYYFKSAVEDVCLTAHMHKFMEMGLQPGVVTTEEFEREDSQIWDLLMTKPGEFWLINHKYSLSEVGIQRSTGPFPPKNFLTFVPIRDHHFLMKASDTDKCIQYQGKHEKTTYAPCDKSVEAQHWSAEYLYEEEKVVP